MSPLLLILILVLIFGAGGGYYGYRTYGPQGGAGIGLGTIALIILVWYVLTHGRL